jgi:hypothetical protein
MENKSELSFGARFSTGMSCFFRALSDSSFARQAKTLLEPSSQEPAPAPKPKPLKPAELPPERAHASALALLALLQREGRLIDFLQEDVASFSDADVGAASRVVHSGCKKVLKEYLTLESALPDSEGSVVNVPPGYDAQRIRLTGNVAGKPPFRGTLKHHGWVATSVRFPAVAETMDARVLAPAEVEL